MEGVKQELGASDPPAPVSPPSVAVVMAETELEALARRIDFLLDEGDTIAAIDALLVSAKSHLSQGRNESAAKLLGIATSITPGRRCANRILAKGGNCIGELSNALGIDEMNRFISQGISMGHKQIADLDRSPF